MREIVRYEALDGKLFDDKDACQEYEKDHPFLNPKAIKFYSINGKKIKDPSESVFIDSNRFIVFNESALLTYQEYCQRFGLKAPHVPTMSVTYPLHYAFKNNSWNCYEELIAIIESEMDEDFTSEYEDNEEDRHNLADCG